MNDAIQTLTELAAAEGMSALSAKHAGTDAGLKATIGGMHAAALGYAARRLQEIEILRENTARAVAAKVVPVREVTPQEALTDTQRSRLARLWRREEMTEPNITPGARRYSLQPNGVTWSVWADADTEVAECHTEADAKAVTAEPDVHAALLHCYRVMLVNEFHRLSVQWKGHEHVTDKMLVEAAHDVIPIQKAKAALIKAGYTV